MAPALLGVFIQGPIFLKDTFDRFVTRNLPTACRWVARTILKISEGRRVGVLWGLNAGNLLWMSRESDFARAQRPIKRGGLADKFSWRDDGLPVVTAVLFSFFFHVSVGIMWKRYK